MTDELFIVYRPHRILVWRAAAPCARARLAFSMGVYSLCMPPCVCRPLCVLHHIVQKRVRVCVRWIPAWGLYCHAGILQPTVYSSACIGFACVCVCVMHMCTLTQLPPPTWLPLHV